jgi:hypothetical protein
MEAVISVIEVKKELYKKKELTAKFVHFDNHKLYYTIELDAGKFMFPIKTLEGDKPADENNPAVEGRPAADVRGAIFGLEVKASELNRWIEKAIKSDDFVKIG